LSASIVRGHAADLERLGRERDLTGAPALLAQLDTAVAALLTEMQKAHRQ